MSTLVTATAPVVVERPLYFNADPGTGAPVDGGTDVTGATSAERDFFFAEGTVRPGFQEYLTLQNPATATVSASVAYQLADGRSVAPQTLTIPAGTRRTLDVNAYLAGKGVTGIDVSAHVTADNDIVVERPLYFVTGLAGGVDGGTDVIGYTGPPEDHRVQMVDFVFDPDDVTVTVGSTVTWVYTDTQCDVISGCPGHNTVADEKGPDGQPLWRSDIFKGQGKTFTAFMTIPGRHHYICTIHGGPNKNNPLTNMEGFVTVVRR